nr:hypothetical protein [Iamia sp. SCSIO 61187]
MAKILTSSSGCSLRCSTATKTSDPRTPAVIAAMVMGAVQPCSAPSANRPMMPPAPAKPAQIPMALAFSSAGKLVVMTDSVTGMTMAAATPARTRRAMSVLGSPANAEATFTAAKATSPMASTGFRPQRPPMAPAGMSSAARATV